MPRYAHPDRLDGGPNYLIANVNKIVVLKNFSIADTFNTVNVTNNILEVATTGSEFTITGANGAARVVTTPAKNAVTATADSGAITAMHVAFVDTVNSRIIEVYPANGVNQIDNLKKYDIPSFTITEPQSVAAA